MPFVYSTGTNDTAYTSWQKSGNDLPRRKKSVTIKGGRGWTPNRRALFAGVTQISDEDAAFLMEDKAFQRHEKAGFVRIEGARQESEAVVSGMETRDGASPLVVEDFAEDKAPKVSTSLDEDERPKRGKRRGRA